MHARAHTHTHTPCNYNHNHHTNGMHCDGAQLDEARALMILVIVTVLHGSLALFLKIYFYS